MDAAPDNAQGKQEWNPEADKFTQPM